MPEFLTLDDVDVSGKTVLVRVDINSPIDPETKRVLDDTRIRLHAKTIKELVDKGAKVVVLAHQGRPGEPDFVPLKEHAEILGRILNVPVKYVDDVCGERAQAAIRELKPGEVLVLENVRTLPYEREKRSAEEHAQTELVKNLAPLADLFVFDGFSVAHRSHASVVGFTAVLPSVAGRVMEAELKALSKALEAPEKPCIFILGGAKAEKCVGIIRYVLERGIADKILAGGLVGHVLLAAKGVQIGEPNMQVLVKKGLADVIPDMKEFLERYPERIMVPEDVAVEVDGERREVKVSELPTNYPIFDVGMETMRAYKELVRGARSIVVSGPLGVYEKPPFVKGTSEVFGAVAESDAYSLAGGGDTAAVLRKLGLHEKFSYVSTAGGAFIEYLMGKKLPAVEALKAAAKRMKP